MYHSVGKCTEVTTRCGPASRTYCLEDEQQQSLGQTDSPESKAALWGWAVLGALVLGTVILNSSGSRSRT